MAERRSDVGTVGLVSYRRHLACTPNDEVSKARRVRPGRTKSDLSSVFFGTSRGRTGRGQRHTVSLTSALSVLWQYRSMTPAEPTLRGP